MIDAYPVGILWPILTPEQRARAPAAATGRDLSRILVGPGIALARSSCISAEVADVESGCTETPAATNGSQCARSSIGGGDIP